MKLFVRWRLWHVSVLWRDLNPGLGQSVTAAAVITTGALWHRVDKTAALHPWTGVIGTLTSRPSHACRVHAQNVVWRQCPSFLRLEILRTFYLHSHAKLLVYYYQNHGNFLRLYVIYLTLFHQRVYPFKPVSAV